MPIVVDGVTYYHYPRAVVVDSTGDPVENLTGGSAVLPNGDGSALPVLDFASLVPLASLTTSAQGLLPDVWIASGSVPLTVELDWPDDGVPAQAWAPSPEEVVEHVTDVATAAGADAVAAAQAAQAAAEAAAAAAGGGTAEPWVIPVVNSYEEASVHRSSLVLVRGGL